MGHSFDENRIFSSADTYKNAMDKDSKLTHLHLVIFIIRFEFCPENAAEFYCF